MRLPVPAQGLAFLLPHTHLPALTGCRPVLSAAADGHCPGGIKGLSKDGIIDQRSGKRRILHLDALQMRTAKSQPREIETAQVTALQEEQNEHVGRSVALRVICLRM